MYSILGKSSLEFCMFTYTVNMGKFLCEVSLYLNSLTWVTVFLQFIAKFIYHNFTRFTPPISILGNKVNEVEFQLLVEA